MKLSGYRKFGLAIFCGVYNTDDQNAWDRFVARIRQNALAYIDHRQDLLAPFLDFHVLGQPDATGTSATQSLDKARELFARWCSENVSTTDSRSMLP